MPNANVEQTVNEVLQDGKPRSFTLPADSFNADRSGELAPFLRSLTDRGLRVEIRGSTEALADANIYPGTAVEGCSIYEGDSGEAGLMLRFLIEPAK